MPTTQKTEIFSVSNNSKTIVNGSNSDESLTGGATAEQVDAKVGTDTATGGAGDDWVKGGEGNDSVDGGAGSDRVDGNAGNDKLIYKVGENAGAKDVYDGGSGTNTLVLEMTRDEWMRDDIQADIAALLRFLASTAPNANGANSSSGFKFTSVGLEVRRIAAVEVRVDGVAQDPRDEPVDAVNDAQVTATEHSVITADVTDNDSVPDLVRAVELVTAPAKGTLTLSADGNFSYDPGMAFDTLAVGQSATASFTYRVSDADRDSDTATNTITITGTNDAPIANADSGSTDENQTLKVDVLANDTDVDQGDKHTVTLASVATGLGTVAIVDNQVQWTPGKDYDYLAVNETAQVTLKYTQSDGNGGSDSDLLTITVVGSNDKPVASDDSASTGENAVATVDVLANDTDLDKSDTHVVTLATLATGQVATGGLDSKVTAEPGGQGSVAIVANKVQWTPGSDFDYLGQGDSAGVTINYTLSDNHAATDDGVLNLKVVGSNDAPTVTAALAETVSEQDPAFGIDLLAGAQDVDQGAVLSVSGFAETGTLGGWTLNGNSLSFDPNHFDPLNTGQTANLNFTYQVKDEHGATANQSLTVAVEGYTDAPLLAVVASAGSAVNEVKLRISTQPATNERVALSFANLPAGATVLDANRQNVSNGVANMVGTKDFFVVLPPHQAHDVDLDVIVTGMRPDNTAIASRTGTLDLLYDYRTAQDEVLFTSEDQGMWAQGAAPMVQWHEYIPILGGVDREWDGTQWLENRAEPWRSGEFPLISAKVTAADAIQVALSGPKALYATALAAFNAADTVAKGIYNVAVGVYNGAKSTAEAAYNWAVGEAKTAFDKVVGETAALATQAAYDIYNAAVATAAWVRDKALDVDFLDWFTGAIWDTYNLAVGVARDALNLALDGINGLATEARNLYDGAVTLARNTMNDALKLAGDALYGARVIYEKAIELPKIALDAAHTELNNITNTLNAQVQGETKLEIKADLFAEVGVQVDFVLDSGSVDTEVQYQLSSVIQHNQTTDVLVITPMMANMTTGTEVAFSTMSPYAKFHAVLLYDVGANLDVFVDSNLVVKGVVIWDLSPGTDGVNIGTTVSTGGWGADFEEFKAGIVAATGEGGVNFDGVEVGEFVLVDFDTRDIGQVEVPFVGTLTEDIVSVEVGLPYIETEGKAAAYNPSFFAEGGLIGVDITEITQSVLNLINARIDFSPELRAKISGLPSLWGMDSIDEAVNAVGKIFLGTVFDALDGQVESTPIFLIDANDQTPSELIHANLIPDSVMGSTLDANTAKFGFYTAYGESNDLVKITIDIDQAVAVIVNKIVEVALGAASSGATVDFLLALPDINPLDLEFSLADILAAFKIPPGVISEFFDVSIGFEAADADVYSSLHFSQEFSLTIDDMLYQVTLEDGEEFLFAANQEGSLKIPNASSHDADGDGVIEYDMQLVPKAMFSNDTEIGLTVGYVLDFLQASLTANLKIPGLDTLLDIEIPGLPEISFNLVDIALGPMLRVQGDLDLASADIFEARFPMNLGSADVNGGSEITDETLVTVVGTPLPV